MNLKCSHPDSIILISKALYGRLRAGRCITSDYAHALGCYSDVSSYLEMVCSGHPDCSMLVATVDSVAQPCPKDFKSYLEVTYVCAPGELSAVPLIDLILTIVLCMLVCMSLFQA